MTRLLNNMAVSSKSRRSDFPKGNWNSWPVEEQVRLFQEQVQGWMIDVAKDIKQKQIPHADFAILAIVLSYFENIAKFVYGYDDKHESKNHFIKGIKLVYPKKLQKKTIELLYDQARNGMYHVGITGPKIELDCSISCGFIFKKGKFIICPEKLIEEIQKHFDKYCSDLKNSKKRSLKKNFIKRYKFLLAI